MTAPSTMTSTLPPITQAFSGAFGGAVANSIAYPLDLVTTRLQATRSKNLRGVPSRPYLLTPHPDQFSRFAGRALHPALPHAQIRCICLVRRDRRRHCVNAHLRVSPILPFFEYLTYDGCNYRLKVFVLLRIFTLPCVCPAARGTVEARGASFRARVGNWLPRRHHKPPYIDPAARNHSQAAGRARRY